MTPFTYSTLPTRVVFGRGKVIEAANEAKRLGMKRPLVITTPHQADSAAAIVKATGWCGLCGGGHAYADGCDGAGHGCCCG